MSSSLRRGAVAAVFAFSTVSLAACGAGHDALTGNMRPDNASAQVDDIKVQNVNVILSGDAGAHAAVSARLFNDGTRPQTLEAVALPGGGSAQLVPAEGESRVVLPPSGSVALGGEGNAAVVVPEPEASGLALGNAQQVVFHLSESGEVGVRARTVPATGAFAYYADWAPTPLPSPEPTPEPTAEPSPGTAGSPEPPEAGAGESPESPEAAESASRAPSPGETTGGTGEPVLPDEDDDLGEDG